MVCWGSNTQRELGDGTSDDSAVPVEVRGLPDLVTALAAGERHTCALTEAGAVKCWGSNSDGELGIGTDDYTEEVVEVNGLPGRVMAIAAGEGFTCALAEDGGMRCWGANAAGQLGDGTTEARWAPVVVRGLPGKVFAMAAGASHACAVTAGGAVRCWGDNEVGQLGDDSLLAKAPATVMVAEASGYRPMGLLVPELTTHIPTPLDVSTDPTVVGANLLLAALATVLFTVASELLNAALAAHEAELQTWFRTPRWLDPALRKVEALLGARLSHPALLDVVRVGAIVLFYGLIFSLLEKGWNPLSVTGVYLLLSMALAFGLVGIADDLAKWRAARRWGIPTSLTLRPANLILAAASTAFSRALALVPGVMFGTPEAFEIDRKALDRRREVRLLLVGSGTILAIGVGVWLLTTLTTLLRRAALPDWGLVVVAGVESLMLIVFAVSVQNAFLQMLALPGSYGRALMAWNRWAWAAGLLAVTFLFYHTLVNPQGDLARALDATNVRFFFFTVGLFVAGSLGVWLYFRQLARRAAAWLPTPAPQILTPVTPECPEVAPIAMLAPEPAAPEGNGRPSPEPAAPSGNGHPPAEPPPPTPPERNETAAVAEASLASALAEAPAVAAPPAIVPAPAPAGPDGTKKCPQCAEPIQAEAKVCRYCGARVNQRDLYFWDRQGEGVGLRFSAWLGDQILILSISTGIALGIASLLGPSGQDGFDSELSATALLLTWPVLWVLYFTLLEGAFGATFGKMRVLRVVRTDGSRAGFGRAAVLALLGLLEANPIGASAIWTSPRRQRLADRLAGTVVVGVHKLHRVRFGEGGACFEMLDGHWSQMARLTRGVVLRGPLGATGLRVEGAWKDGRPIVMKLRCPAFRSRPQMDLLRARLEAQFGIPFERRVDWAMVAALLAVLAVIGGAGSVLRRRAPDLFLQTPARADARATSPALASATPGERPTSTPAPEATGLPAGAMPGVTPTPAPSADDTGTATGRILWNDEPMAGVTVKLCLEWSMVGGCKTAEYTAVSGADGWYTLAGLPPGEYEFATQMPEQSNETGWLG